MEDLRYRANKAMRALLRTGAGVAKVAAARLRGRRFYCRVLAGEANYNLTINADLSVSCNCNDGYGRGRLGDLRTHSFREVLAGPVAAAFRRALARGRLPIPECATCRELAAVPAAVARQRETVDRDPVGIQLETVGGCNLSCIGCERRERPLRSLKMKDGDLRRVMAEVAAMGVRRLSLFSLNEPFLSKTILREMMAIRAAAPRISIPISTNGVLLDSDDKRMAALMADQITFSIDGCDQATAERYQIGMDFAAAHANLRALAQARAASGAGRPLIVWKYVLFRWNQREDMVMRAIDLARDAGADRIDFVFTLTPLYGVAWGYHLHRFWRRIGRREGKRHTVELRRA